MPAKAPREGTALQAHGARHSRRPVLHVTDRFTAVMHSRDAFPIPQLRPLLRPIFFSGEMEQLCDGSRRPVVGARHELKTLKSGHQTATCPVCRRRLKVKRVLGVLEFPRHER